MIYDHGKVSAITFGPPQGRRLELGRPGLYYMPIVPIVIPPPSAPVLPPPEIESEKDK